VLLEPLSTCLFKVSEVDALEIEEGRSVATMQLDLSEKKLGGVLNEVAAEVAVDDGIAALRQNEQL